MHLQDDALHEVDGLEGIGESADIAKGLHCRSLCQRRDEYGGGVVIHTVEHLMRLL